MSAPSPVQAEGALNSFSISTDGSPLDSAVQLFSIETWTEVSRLPKARLVIFDGSAADQDFPLSAAASFKPGAALQIEAGYDGLNARIFSGVICKQSLEISENGASQLIVEATDQAAKMTLARGNAVFEQMTDSQVIEKLIKAASVTAKVTATTAQQPVIVQYYCSAWDLMLTRAEVNGMVVMVEGGVVTVAPPDTASDPVLSVTFGESILDLALTMDATTQYSASAIKSYSWNPATLQVQNSASASANVSTPGNLSSAELAKVFGISDYPQQSAGFDAPANLTAWSSGDLLKSMLAKIRGQVTFQGSALAVLGKTIELAGLGDRFNGNGFISGVYHEISEGRWTTQVTIGLSPQWFSAMAAEIVAPGAAGLVEPIPGLQSGIVQKISGDPDGEFRVFVTLPLLQAASGAGVWARMGSFYASKGIGAEFFPEIGDEVAVAFMNQDPRYPVIMGSLYSKTRAPLYPPDEKNTMKAIVSQAKLQVTFNDVDKIIQVLTPGGHKIVLDDKAGSISIKDSNGNSAVFASGGVTLDSASNMTLTAKGNISVTAQGNLALKANANATMEGMQVSHTAQTQFSANANVQASVSGSAMLTLKGGLVQIN